MRKLLFVLLTYVLVSLPRGASAQQGPAQVDLTVLESGSIFNLIDRIAGFVLAVGIPLAAAFMVYSGFLFVTAGGNEEQLSRSKKNFWWTVVGTAVLLAARVIVTLIKNTLMGIEG